VHAYESVAVGTPLLTILDDHELEVAMVVPAAWLGWLAPGKRFALSLDGSSRASRGELTRLGAQVDPVSQTLTVYGVVTEPTAGLMPGLTATVSFAPP
jgi:membrane fusion protein, multidrug efflux system